MLQKDLAIGKFSIKIPAPGSAQIASQQTEQLGQAGETIASRLGRASWCAAAKETR